jgi:hypothetical protein
MRGASRFGWFAKQAGGGGGGWTITPGAVNIEGAVGTNTPTTPSGSVGDLLVSICINENANGQTVSAGWDARLHTSNGFGNIRLGVATRIADGLADDTLTVTFSGSPTTGSQAAVLRISGHDAGTPYDVGAAVGANTTNPHVLPSISTTEGGALLLAFSGSPSPDLTSGPSGYTLVIQSEPAANSLLVWSKEATAAGSYGGEDITYSAGMSGVVAIIAINPA